MNKFLKNDLELILKNPTNVRVGRGNVGGNSIEVEYIEEQSFESYIYKDAIVKRDSDLTELINLLKEKV